MVTDGFLQYGSEEEAEPREPATPRRGKHEDPCDVGPPYLCPWITDDSQATGMYFCRDHCGVGVDD